MASPIGHSLCGYAIYSTINKKINWKELLGFIVVANLADIDFLFGFLIGEPNKYHHQFTHSIFISLIIAAVVACYFKFRNRRQIRNIFITVFSLYSSHVIIDYFTRDTSPPYGEQLFWPFSNNYFISSISIFRDIYKASTSSEFFLSLFSYYNLWTILTEVIIFTILIVMVKIVRYSGRSGDSVQNSL